MQSTKIAIEPDGAITMIYSDDAAELIDQGAAVIRRVSNVEPADPDLCRAAGVPAAGWMATMTDGIVLGPYRLRAEALDAEIAYLEAQLF